MSNTGRRLLWALGISIVLHLVLVFGMHIELPRPEPEPADSLTVKLESLRPVPQPTPAKPVPRKTQSAPAARPAPPVPVPESPAPIPPSEPAAPVVEAAPLVSEPPPPPAKPLTPLPRRIEIVYTLYKGEQKLNVGRMTHTWNIDGTQYTLTSIAEATGLFSLFVRGTLIQVSRGELTEEGLQPGEFWIQRGQSGNRTESASFDWSGKLLRFGRANEQKTQMLKAGTQDVLSVLYQLALTAPHTGTLDLAVTNGRKFDRYVYRVVGEEMLETPLGNLKTQHLAKVRAGDEDGLDVWLAAEYHYLPVRVHITDKKGDTAEQVATSIGGE